MFLWTIFIFIFFLTYQAKLIFERITASQPILAINKTFSDKFAKISCSKTDSFWR